ncbi:MAG: hypothetical protein HQK53_18690 [Oligoflexia bacterium]|nr:hypothetical protein [Oligoflexia bacterium]
MTAQEAYNKGLDDAENLAVVKFSNALIGNDDGPFNNPQMEDIRQQILNKPTNPPFSLYSPCGDSYTLHVMLDEPFDKTNLNSLDEKVIEILEYVKSLVGPKPRSRISVKIKKLLTDLKVDFIKNYGKLD